MIVWSRSGFVGVRNNGDDAEMLNYLVVVFALTMIIHTAETLSYSVRYAGVKLNKIAVALSLTGIVVLISRTANLVQAPLTAKFVDYAKTHPSFHLITLLEVHSSGIFRRHIDCDYPFPDVCTFGWEDYIQV